MNVHMTNTFVNRQCVVCNVYAFDLMLFKKSPICNLYLPAGSNSEDEAE